MNMNFKDMFFFLIKARIFFVDSFIKGNLFNRIIFYLQSVRFESFPKVKGAVYLRNKGSIHLGRNIQITSGDIHNPLGGSSRTYLITGENAIISIGDKSRISNSSIFSLNSISVGENVFIGGNSKIYDSDFHSVVLENRLKPVDDDVCSKPIKISDGVFIGAHSIILKGVTIGTQSVIGAGSIVTKNVPPYQIWAGNPAKFIRNLD